MPPESTNQIRKGLRLTDLLNNLLRPGTCPKCDYMLRGLPDPVRCPECGLMIGDDLTFRGWHGAVGPLTVFTPRDFLPGIALFVLYLMIRTWAIVYSILLGSLVVGWKLGYYFFKTRRPPTSHIWLSQRGYSITFTRKDRTLTPWPSGSSVIFEAVEGFALIWLIKGLADHQRTIIGTAAVSRAEAREIERRVKQWLSTPHPRH